jgi:alkylation response protein AidB-like acyl-CoA dehydrogenase
MNLDLNETQILLRDTLREYLENELPLSRTRQAEREERADADLWSALHEHGWLGVSFSPSLGGGGGTLIEAGLLVEEVARRAALVPVLEALTCAATIHRYAEGERAGQIVSQVLAGECTPVPAVLEAADRFDRIALEAGADGRLRGEKYFVDYAEFATHHVVAATRGGEIGLYLVKRADPAVKAEPLHSIGRIPQAIVRYDGVQGELLCGPEGYRFLVNLARALCSVQMLGCMQQSLDMSVAYTSVREQFGRPIGSFQAVHHHCANMATHVESTRFLAYEALDALERGTATDAQVALAKAAASRAVPEVTMLGQQVHGGQGYIEENDLYFFTLRGKDRSLAWGSAEECLRIVAETVEQPANWL